MIAKRMAGKNRKNREVLRCWRDSLTAVPAFLIGNGPSLLDHSAEEKVALAEMFTIGINRAFKWIDPTILLWQDLELWLSERKHLKDLKAIHYSKQGADPEHIAYHFLLNKGDHMLPINPTALNGTGSSGPLAFQLAYALGCNPIILLGYDCCYRKNMTDFYGINSGHKERTLMNCIKGLKWLKGCQHERQVINCSDNNVFENRVKLGEAIDVVSQNMTNKGRDFYVTKLFGREFRIH